MRFQTDIVTLVMMLTDVCNLDCVHCFKSNASLAELPFSAIEKALHGFKQRFGNLHVSLSGGEPTLHRRFGDILALLAAENQTFHMVTNAFNFKRRTLPMLLAHGKTLECVAFSMDGPDARTHDRTRGKGSFDRVLEAIQLCRMHGIGTRVCCTLTRWNVHKIDAMRRFVQQQGLTHGVYLWSAIPTRRLYEQGALLDDADRAYLIKRREALEKEGVFLIGDLKRMDDEYQICEALNMRQFTLDADGNLSLCCNLTHYADETSRDDVLGSVLDTDLTTLIERHIDATGRYMKVMLNDLKGIKDGDPHAYACTHCARYHGKLDWLEAQTTPDLMGIEAVA